MNSFLLFHSKSLMYLSVTCFISLSPPLAKSLLWLAVMLMLDYAAVICAVVIDLRSGVIRARREGRRRTSRGYRQTVEKLSRYLVTLLALSAVDALIAGTAMLLVSTMGWNLPVMPLFTTLGALALCFIEGKSVVENTQRRADFTDAASSVADLLTDRELQRLATILRRLISSTRPDADSNQ